MRFFTSIGLPTAILLTLGCGDSKSSESHICGEGTELVEGVCLPSHDDVECGAGATLVDGVCVGGNPVSCGAGATLVDGVCVGGDPASCGAGATLVDGVCVGGDPVSCGPGTELVDGECVSTCDAIDGVCRPACDVEGAPFGGGEGTWDAPYRICTTQHLLEVGNHPDKEFVLTRHLDLGLVVDFAPLGGADPGKGFSGRFDGAGLELRNLTIDQPSDDFVGLFHRIEEGGHVGALGLVDFTVTGRDYVGGLAGLNAGHIIDSYTTGAITGRTEVGGLVGFSSGSITSSYAAADVTGAVAAEPDSDDHTGGLVGHNSSGSITGSYATGDVVAYALVGGLVGRSSSGSITSSYATGDVTGAWAIGGLVGMTSEVSITSSYATGAATATGGNVGGLIGFDSTESPSDITACYFLDPDDESATLGEPLMREAFGDALSFEDWDFDHTWVMRTFDEPDFERPALRDNPETP